MVKFEILFSGHENVRSNHEKTLEITTCEELTPRGDCIVGVGAGCGCAGLPGALKALLKDSEVKVRFSIRVEGDDEVFTFSGYGHPDLVFSDTEDLVVRKSGFVCPRTLAVGCDKASDMMPRSMVQRLQNPKAVGVFSICVE